MRTACAFFAAIVVSEAAASADPPPARPGAPTNVTLNVTNVYISRPIYRSVDPQWSGSGPLSSFSPPPYQLGSSPPAPPAALLPRPIELPRMLSLTPPFQPALAAPGGQPGAPGEVDQAISFLSSPREADRAEAAILLGRHRVERAVEPLARVLAGDTSPRVREVAARALGLIGTPAAYLVLDRAAQTDDNREVRYTARFAAEMIRGGMQRP